MATCINTCTSGVKTNLTLGTLRLDPIGSIEYGKMVNVSIDVSDHSFLIGGNAVIDVTNVFDGSCVYNEGFWLSQGATRIVNFSIRMPNNDMNLRISASSWVVPLPPLPAYWRCEDIKEFSVKQKYVKYDCVGTGTSKHCVGPVKDGAFADEIACEASGCKPAVTTYTYVCPGKGLDCKPVTDGSGYSTQQACVDAGCKTAGGGTGTTCPNDQTNLSGLLGKCYPKNDVYIGAVGLALLYMFMTKK